MRFYTNLECDDWLSDRHRGKPNATPNIHSERISYPPSPHRLRYFAHWIATSLTYRMPALLWITDWGVWAGSENWHLYYKLRRTDGDPRLLHEAPGHLFLEHEVEDLATYLQLAMLNGWGGYLLTHANYVNALFNHDEFIEFFSEQATELVDIRKALGDESKTGK